MRWDKDQPLEELRYERKFLVDELDSHHVRALVKLHPMMFVQPYPPRYVNNMKMLTGWKNAVRYACVGMATCWATPRRRCLNSNSDKG